MNKLYLIFLLLSNSIWAQDSIPRPIIHKQFGLNATQFIKTFLAFTSSTPQISKYTVSLKTHNENTQRAKRASYGVSFLFAAPLSSNDDLNIVIEFNGKWGIEKRTKLTPKWTFYRGADFLSSVELTSTEQSGFGRQGSFGVNIGGGPMMGIEYRINKRMVLATEAAFYPSIGVNYINNNRTFGGSGGDLYFTVAADYSAPTNIYLFIDL
jgi:hypothetical protein